MMNRIIFRKLLPQMCALRSFRPYTSLVINNNNKWYENTDYNQWSLIPSQLMGSLPKSGHLMVSLRFGSHKPPITYDFIRERILLVLRLYDKVDPDKLTLNSHFYNDLGLDSLDHVEVIMAMEDEFHMEIPDCDAEKLLTPADLLRYVSDKEEAYEELQKDDHH